MRISKKFLLPLMIVLCLVSMILHLCCRSGAGKSIDRVILITLDTTRADRLGCYGYGKIKTPNLDQLATEGILFENAICQVPVTLPSHISMLTGLYPPEFEVRDNLGYILKESILTLPEILRERGFATAAVVSSFALSSHWGLAQGFDSFSEPREERVGLIFNARKADFTISAALNWLGGSEEAKYFLWIHLFDPHSDYKPPPPFSEIYKDSLYDGEIAYMDSEIGRLWEFLKRKKMWDDSLIIVAGDHGEGLEEHNELRHGNLVYESTVRIPLIIKGKGLPANRRITKVAATIDILPTILDHLKIETPQQVRGKSLLPLMKDLEQRPADEFSERELYFETLHPNIVFGWNELKGIRRGNWKYINALVPELYDLQKDPQETQNLFRSEQMVASKLSAALKESEAGLKSLVGRSSHIIPDEKSRAALRSLGYVSVTISEHARPTAKNPKDYAYLEPKLEECLKASEKNDHAKVIDICASILKADPENKAAGVMHAQALISTGEIDAAIGQLKSVLSTYEDDYLAAGLLAKTYFAKQSFSEAEKVFLKAMKYHPDSFDFTYGLGVSYFGQGRHDEAIGMLEQAISLNPENHLPYLMLSRCYEAKGLNEKAAESMQKARRLGFRG